jgi:non-SMC mitotic condensation complex subunit 1, N-term
LEEDIQFLWYETKVEEDFIRVFVKTGFDMLENPNNTKVADVKDKLFAILQRTMERFGGDVKYMQS